VVIIPVVIIVTREMFWDIRSQAIPSLIRIRIRLP